MVGVLLVGFGAIPLQQARALPCIWIRRGIIEQLVTAMGGIEGVSHRDDGRLNRLCRNMNFPREALIVSVMELPTILPRARWHPRFLVHHNVAIGNVGFDLHFMVDLESQGRIRSRRSHVRTNMDVTLRVYVRIHVVRKRTGHSLAKTERHRAVQGNSTGLLIGDIEGRVTGTQFSRQIDGESIALLDALTGGIEGQIGGEGIPESVRPIGAEFIGDISAGDDSIDFSCRGRWCSRRKNTECSGTEQSNCERASERNATQLRARSFVIHDVYVFLEGCRLGG